ncbi:hypothetical protein OHB41_47735 [Streptomyces sp. NBC_01571]|uniref:hypothetical protein n=1 Tax=Streptomyces sp. NBC_01571 TaxID=2975883 RepID=UPI0022503872|nr:hypothetical protein [Streptomyces sp. NBC_01571]MCX4580687.1 hypothetical protein [Streptomyces sp. NBC_01571]
MSDPPGTGRYLYTAGDDRPAPAKLLERGYQHQRVAAPTALAGNPHTPRAAVTDALPTLHPVELSWICQQNGIPDWLHSAAAALAPEDDETAVLRLLTDDELDQHPDPGGVLPSWLGEVEGFDSTLTFLRAKQAEAARLTKRPTTDLDIPRPRPEETQ